MRRKAVISRTMARRAGARLGNSLNIGQVMQNKQARGNPTVYPDEVSTRTRATKETINGRTVATGSTTGYGEALAVNLVYEKQWEYCPCGCGRVKV